MSNMSLIQGQQMVDLHSSFKNLINRRWAMRRLLGVMTTHFRHWNGILWHSIGEGNLDFNIYSSVKFNGVMGMPAYFVSFILMERWNRKRRQVGYAG